MGHPANLEMKAKIAEDKRREREEAAAAKATAREANLQLAEEKRQEKEEAAAAKAALRQVNLEAKAQLAEARRQERKALADVKAGLREFKAERAGQKDQTKKFMKEMNKDFQKVLKGSLTSKPTANSSTSTCEPSGAEATGSADLECAVENSVPTIDKVTPGAEPTDTADLECAVENSVPAMDEVTVPVANPVVMEEVSEVIPDLCKEASDVSQNSSDV